MKDVVGYLEGKGIRDRYAVIVGGAAPTPEFTADIGADAHGHTAAEAVRICSQIMTGSTR
jgi:methanogenic corrinoid protein MtbC1